MVILVPYKRLRVDFLQTSAPLDFLVRQAETSLRGFGLNTASDGRTLRDLDLAAAMQQPRPLRCRTPSAGAADQPSKVQPCCSRSSSVLA